MEDLKKLMDSSLSKKKTLILIRLCGKGEAVYVMLLYLPSEHADQEWNTECQL